jgi:hypothetical protein
MFHFKFSNGTNIAVSITISEGGINEVKKQAKPTKAKRESRLKGKEAEGTPSSETTVSKL